MSRFAFLLIFLLAAITARPTIGQEAIPLEQDEVLEGELESDVTHQYTVDLDAGQFVYGEAFQKTVDVIVRVFGPDDLLVGEFDSPARGPEPFRFTTDTAGTYRLEITPFEEETGAYSVTLLLVEPKAETPAGRVDQLLAGYHGDDTPGGVVAVVEGGELVFAKGYGMANLEYGIPNSPTTVYHVASVSKQFTAFAIAMLADQGGLSLNDDIHKYIPELPDFDKVITLRHLLNHTSGLRDQWDLWVMSGGLMDDVIRQEDLLRLVEGQRELNFDPGAEYLYCNTGYMLLAETVKRVTDEPFGAWMEAHVFEPLMMTSTQIYDDHERVVEGRAYSYRYAEDGFNKAVLSYANAGATSLFTTVEDLAKWLHNFYTAEVGGRAVVAQMQERGVLTSGDTIDYALGVGIGKYRGLRVIQHGGADAGYRTMLSYYPEIDAGVVVFSNLGSFNTGQAAREVADAFFARHLEPEEVAPDEAEEEMVTVTPDRLDAYAGEYVIEGGPTVYIIREDDGLYSQVEGQRRFALVALSDTLFRVQVPGVDAHVSFHIEPDGSVDRATIHQNGDTPMRRAESGPGLEPWSPDAEALAAYSGRYFSPELETFYTLVVEEDHLVARHRRHGDIKLSPEKKDVFSGNIWFIGEVQFERNEAGDVTGMRVSNGRVRRLLFEKQE